MLIPFIFSKGFPGSLDALILDGIKIIVLFILKFNASYGRK